MNFEGGAPLRVRSIRACASAAVVLFGFGAIGPAFADDNGIETVTVTAEKRTELLQKVPVSVAVVNADTLQNFDMNQTTDLQYLVPDVHLIDAAGPRNFGFFIRGIGTSSFASESIEGSTAFVLDGVVLGQAGASLSDLPDITHVEVLRGPQGTLFGSNASAGVINVTTRNPSDTFEEDLGGSLAEPFNERKVYGLVTGPISDDLKFLISGRLNQTDGLVDNVYDGRKLNNRNDYGFRGKLEYTPLSNLDVMFIADYYDRDTNCCIWTLQSVGVGGPPAPIPELQSIAAGIVPSVNNLKQNVDGPVFAKEKSYGASTQVDYDFSGGYTLTSITAYRRWLSVDGLDSDSSPLNILDANFARFGQSQVSEELRIASPLGGLVDYVAGLYYYDQHVFSESVQLFPTLPFPLFNRIVDNTATESNFAGFGQANVNVTKQFRIILGGRLLTERDTAIKNRFDPVLIITTNAQAAKTNNAAVWRAGLQYDITPDNMVFATATRGFKGGGFDTNIGISNLTNVLPERPMDYEVGLRNSFPDQRLIFNVTAFHDHVVDYQVSALVPGPPPVASIGNSEAFTEGVEFDSTWQPMADIDWLLTANGSYDNAYWGNYPTAPCYSFQTLALGCTAAGVQNLTGQQLPFAPKWTFDVQSSYTTQFPGEPWKLGFNGDISYHSNQGIAFPNDPNTIQKGFALLNISASVSDDDGLWRVSLFIKNLTDHNYAATLFGTPFGTGYSQFPVYEARRIVGFSLDLHH